MYYSETKVIMGGLAHVSILIFIVNFIKSKFKSIASKSICSWNGRAKGKSSISKRRGSTVGRL